MSIDTDFADTWVEPEDFPRIEETPPHEKAPGAPEPVAGPVAKRLADLVRSPNDDPDELLRHRFLCRGGGLLVAGPTGVGKSTIGMQKVCGWAVGRTVFGIEPARPLKSLLIQAENDDGDLAEFRDGAIHGLRLTADEARCVGENILVVREDVRVGDRFFSEVMRPLLSENQPDLLWIDPALAYLGGESNSQKDVGAFLRTGLNPLLREFGCAAIITHHTAKPPAVKDRQGRRGTDLAYLGSGSAEWANWPRAVLALEGTGTPGEFRLHAAKRGGRLGWREPDGATPAYQKLLRHARAPGVIFWEEIDTSDPTVSPTVDTRRVQLLALIPNDRDISKDLLIEQAKGVISPQNKVRPLIEALLTEGVLQETKVPRPGKAPSKVIRRVRSADAAPQP